MAEKNRSTAATIQQLCQLQLIFLLHLLNGLLLTVCKTTGKFGLTMEGVMK